MSERKAVIKNADMSEDMQQDAVDCASQALEKYNIEKASTVPYHSVPMVICHGEANLWTPVKWRNYFSPGSVEVE